MEKCPRCQELLPLLSKVCPTCGYVIESGQVTSAYEIANNLEQVLHDMKSVPIPGFIAGMARVSVLIIPIITLFLFVVAWISSAGLFWILFVLFLIWSIFVIIKKYKGTFKADIHEKEILKLINKYEYLSRIAKRDFGDNKEVRKLLNDIAIQKEEIEGMWRSSIRTNVFLWLAILALIVIFSITGTCSVSNVVEEAEKTEMSADADWQEEINKYMSSDASEQNNPEIRLELIKKILKSGEINEAEKFFLKNLMGEIGDMECAKEIVLTYIKDNKTDKAKAFLNKCTDLRYKSDLNKLQKLIN